MNIPKSISLFQEAQALLPGGVNSPVRAFRAVGGQPLFMDRGEGPYLYDVDGNRYIDYVLSWGPLIAGHAHPDVVKRIQAAAVKGTSYGAPSPLEVELAKRIMEFMPNIEMIRFVNSGTEATMSALRLARAYTQRDKIIKFNGCYHGHADLLLVQAGSGVATLGLPDSPGVPVDTVKDTLVAEFNDLNSVEVLFKQYPEQIAAIIIEPVAGNMGVVPPLPGILEALRIVTQKEGALLIFDEVMTGFRVHPGGAQTLYNIQPDLTTLGKVIGGGLPVGAYGGRKEIMQMSTTVNVAPYDPFTANSYTVRNGIDQQVVVYWYQQSGGRIVTNEYLGRIHLVVDSLTKGRSDAALIRISVPFEDDSKAAEQTALDFIQTAYPALVDFLPHDIASSPSRISRH